MKKELFLHIGMGKSGTSVLQHFFTLNRKTLARKGIDYPECAGMFAHHRLPWAFFREEGLQSSLHPEDLRDYQQEWHRLLSQTQASKILLSSEFFLRRMPDSIQIIKELTADFNVKIIVYLRRQDSFEDSWYNQRVKGTRCTPRPPFRSKKLIIATCFNRWIHAFGKANVIVRPYEKDQFYQNSIFADFLHYVLGLEFSDEYVLPERDPNTRLHQVALEYKRMINHLPLSSREKAKLIKPLREVSALLRDQGRVNYSVFSPQQRIEMILEYEAFYGEIARDYLYRADGQLFYTPLPDPEEKWQPYNELLADDARLINDFLNREDPEAMAAILPVIREARSSKTDELCRAAQRLSPGLSLEEGKGPRVLKRTIISKAIYYKIPERIRLPLKKIIYKLLLFGKK